jgi:hypothetical protein
VPGFSVTLLPVSGSGKSLRQIPYWLIIIITGLFFSCGTAKNVFDPNISKKNSVTLKIDPSVKIKSYNGVTVDLTPPFFKTGYTNFIIPTGDAVLLVDVKLDYFVKPVCDIEVLCNFEKGKKYFIYCRRFFPEENGKVPSVHLQIIIDELL